MCLLYHQNKIVYSHQIVSEVVFKLLSSYWRSQSICLLVLANLAMLNGMSDREPIESMFGVLNLEKRVRRHVADIVSGIYIII